MALVPLYLIKYLIFLLYCFFKVKLGSTLSIPTNTFFSVSQSFFLIFINNLFNSINPNIFLYAHDIMIGNSDYPVTLQHNIKVIF